MAVADIKHNFLPAAAQTLERMACSAGRTSVVRYRPPYAVTLWGACRMLWGDVVRTEEEGGVRMSRRAPRG